jgi:hypothetical protein
MDNIIALYGDYSSNQTEIDNMMVIYEYQENYLRYIYFAIFCLSTYIFYLRENLKYNQRLNEKTMKVNDRLVSINNKYKKMIEKINVITNNEESRISKKVCLIKNVLLFNRIYTH